MVGVWVVQLAAAWALLLPASSRPWSLIPGASGRPGPALAFYLHGLVDSHGLLGATHARTLLYPAGTDAVALWGFPLDALLALPLTAFFGHPAGFTLFAVLALAAAGLSMAWFAARWWRSRVAALVAGAAYQTGGLLAWELLDGHPGTVVAAAFLPLCLGQMCLAMASEGRGRAVAAGVLGGVAALGCWEAGGVALVALGVVAALAWIEGRRDWRPALIVAASGVALVGLPALHQLAGAGVLRGIPDGPWGSVERAGQAGTWAGWIATRGLSLGGDGTLLSLRPALLLLLGLGIWGSRGRRWAAPAIWGLVGALLAVGPWLRLPGGASLLGPQLALLALPGLDRMIHPCRALLLTAPALALLAGGGALWLRRALPARVGSWGWTVGAALALVLLIEGWLVCPFLPVPATRIAGMRATPVMVKRQGPALVLPFAAGPLRTGASMLIDQVFHGRPLLNGAVYPGDTVVPEATYLTPAEDALAYLAECEKVPAGPPPPDAASTRAALRAVGLSEVYVEISPAIAHPHGDAYVACLEEVLGSEYSADTPFRIYELTD